MSSSPLPRKRPRRKAAEAAEGKLSSDHVVLEAKTRLREGQRLVVFSGAGLSVSAGVSTFASLYQKAAKKYGGDGKQAFHYRFLQNSPEDSFDFLMQQFNKVKTAKPTWAHEALRNMETNGQLVRHYTMNIDGLAGSSEKVVELHGSLLQLVCRNCEQVTKTNDVLGKEKKRFDQLPPTCSKCKKGELRFRVLLYDDQEGHLITRVNALDTILADDLKHCEWIVWVGASFEQSASCEHLRKMLQVRPEKTPVFIASPEASQALELLQTVVGEVEGLYALPMTSDDFFSGDETAT